MTPKQISARKDYAKNKEAYIARAVQYNKENKEKHNQSNKTWRWKIRLEMIEAYGGKCVCCGETEPQFLTIDHINNDGYSKRLAGEGSGATLYMKLKKLDWPKEEYQLLCMNCNFAKGHFGCCPHTKEQS